MNLSIKPESRIAPFILIILALLPFIILAFYAHPSPTDDYSYVLEAKEMGFWPAFKDRYMNWTGRFTMVTFLALNDYALSNIFFYRFVLIVFIILVPILFYVLISLIDPFKKLSYNLWITAIFNVLYYSLIPQVSEDLYWFAGVVCYQLSNILILLYLIFLLLATRSENYRTFYIVAGCIFTIAAVGTNEMTMSMVLMFNICIFYFFRKRYTFLYIILFVTVLASAVLLISPGNSNRTALFQNTYNITTGITLTFLGIGLYGWEWLPLTFITLFWGGWFFSKSKILMANITSNFFQSFSIIRVAIILVLVIGPAFFLPAYSSGQLPNPRAFHCVLLPYLLFCLYGTLYWLNAFPMKKVQGFFSLNFLSIAILVVSALLIIFIPEKYAVNNYKDAISDLSSGMARDFDKEMNQKYIDIEKQKNLFGNRELRCKPNSLYTSSVTDEMIKYYSMKGKEVE